MICSMDSILRISAICAIGLFNWPDIRKQPKQKCQQQIDCDCEVPPQTTLPAKTSKLCPTVREHGKRDQFLSIGHVQFFENGMRILIHLKKITSKWDGDRMRSASSSFLFQLHHSTENEKFVTNERAEKKLITLSVIASCFYTQHNVHAHTYEHTNTISVLIFEMLIYFFLL